MIPWALIAPFAGKILDKLFPDKEAAELAKRQLDLMEQQGELEDLKLDVHRAIAQIEVNKEEAKSSKTFIAGWRPFIGWMGGLSLGYNFILAPFLTFTLAAFGHPIEVPATDVTKLMTVVLGMLGLG